MALMSSTHCEGHCPKCHNSNNSVMGSNSRPTDDPILQRIRAAETDDSGETPPSNDPVLQRIEAGLSEEGGPPIESVIRDVAPPVMQETATPEPEETSAPPEGGNSLLDVITQQAQRGFDMYLQRRASERGTDAGTPADAPVFTGPGAGMAGGQQANAKERGGVTEKQRRRRIQQSAERIIEKQRDIQQAPQSDQMKRLQQAIADGDPSAMWETVFENPSAAVGLAVQSAAMQPDQLVMSGLGAMMPGGAATTIAGSAPGPVTTETRNAIIDEMRSRGVDLTDEDQVMEALTNPEVRDAAEERGQARGLTIGAVEAGTNVLTGGLGKAGMRPLAKAVLSLGAQTGGEAGGEALAQQAAGEDTNLAEVSAEAIGGLPTSAIETAGTAFQGRTETEAQQDQAEQTQPDNRTQDAGDTAPQSAPAQARQLIRNVAQQAEAAPESAEEADASASRPLADMDEQALRDALQDRKAANDPATVEMIEAELARREQAEQAPDETDVEAAAEELDDSQPTEQPETGETQQPSDPVLERIRQAEEAEGRAERGQERVGLTDLPRDPDRQPTESQSQQPDARQQRPDDADGAQGDGRVSGDAGLEPDVEPTPSESARAEQADAPGESGAATAADETGRDRAQRPSGEQQSITEDLEARRETRPEQQVDEAVEEAEVQYQDARQDVEEALSELERALQEAAPEALNRIERDASTERVTQAVQAERERRAQQGDMFGEPEAGGPAAEQAQDLFGDDLTNSQSAAERAAQALEQRMAGLEQAQQELIRARQRAPEARREARDAQTTIDEEADSNVGQDTEGRREAQEENTDSKEETQTDQGTPSEVELNVEDPTANEAGKVLVDAPDQADPLEATITDDAVTLPAEAAPSPAQLAAVAEEAAQRDVPLQTDETVSVEQATQIMSLADEGATVTRAESATRTDEGTVVADGEPAFTVRAPQVDTSRPTLTTEDGYTVGRAARPVTRQTTREDGGRQTTYRHAPDDIVVTNAEGQLVDRRSGGYEEALAQYFTENEDALREGSVAPRTRDPDAYIDTAAKSPSPQQVLEAYLMQRRRIDVQGYDPVAVNIDSKARFSTDSFDAFASTDWRNDDGQIRLNWLGGEKDLDAAAQEISERTGVDVTPEDIIEHITDHPDGPQRKSAAERRVDALAEQFESLTGIPLTPDLANMLREAQMGERVQTEPVDVEAPFQRIAEDGPMEAAALVEAQVRRIASDMGIPAGEITVVQAPDELPGKAGRIYRRGLDEIGDGFLQPAMYMPQEGENGQVYLVASAIDAQAAAVGMSTQHMARATLMHEAVAHQGLRGLLGENFRPAMDTLFDAIGRERILNAEAADGTRLADAYADQITVRDGTLTPRSRRLLVDEYMARLAEGMTTPDSVLSRIYQALRDAVARALNLRVTDSELELLLQAARDHRRAQQQANPVDGTRFDRRPDRRSTSVRWMMAGTEAETFDNESHFEVDDSKAAFHPDGPIQQYAMAWKRLEKAERVEVASESVQQRNEAILKKTEAESSIERALGRLDEGVPLDQLIAHRTLFRKYPDLRGLEVKRVRTDFPVPMGGIDKENERLSITDDTIRAIREAVRKEKGESRFHPSELEEAISEVMHLLLNEIEHWVQIERTSGTSQTEALAGPQSGLSYTPKELAVRYSRTQTRPPATEPHRAETDVGGDTLVALHNLSADNVRFALNHMDGQIAMPSLGTARYDQAYTSFGSISMVGSPEMVDPAEAPTYAADVYSPRQPEAVFEPKDAEAESLQQMLGVYFDRIDDTEWSSIRADLWDGKRKQFIERVADSPAGKLAYLEEAEGESVDLDRSQRESDDDWQWRHTPLREVLEEIDPDAVRDTPLTDEQRAEITRMTQEAIGGYEERLAYKVASGGSPTEQDRALAAEMAEMERDGLMTDADGLLMANQIRSMARRNQQLRQSPQTVTRADTEAQLQDRVDTRDVMEWLREEAAPAFRGPLLEQDDGTRVPYALDKVREAMTEAGIRGGEEFGGTMGMARAQGAPRFESMEEMQARRDRVDPEAAQAARDRMSSAMVELANHVPHDGDGAAFDALARAWADYFARRDSANQAERALQNEGFRPSLEQVRQFMDLADDMRQMPVDYFETVPQRAVALSEFEAAVVPNDLPDGLMNQLNEAVGTVRTYTPRDKATRQEAIREVATEEDVRFQRESTEADTDDADIPPQFVTPPRSVLGILRTTGKNLKAWLRKNLTSRSTLPKPAFEALVRQEGDVNAAMTRVTYTLRDFAEALRDEYGTDQVSTGRTEQINEALNNGYRDRDVIQADLFENPGDAEARADLPSLFEENPFETGEVEAVESKTYIEDLPERLQKPVANMRDEIDGLSRAGIRTGLFTGELRAKVTKNLGTYLTRAYKVHDDPGWGQRVVDMAKRQQAEDESITVDPEQVADDLPAEEWNQAVAWFREEFPGMSNERIAGELAELMQAETERGVGGSKVGSVGSAIFEKRSDVPGPLRALMGEYTDPRQTYSQSMVKQIHAVTNQKLLNEVKKAGKGEWLFDEPTVKDGTDFTHEIAAEGSRTMQPLNGLYTTPEIAEAFESFNEESDMGVVQDLFFKGVALVKSMKTLGSPKTQFRNFFGNIPFAVTQGHVFEGEAPAAAVEGARQAKSLLPDWIVEPTKNEETLQEWQKLQRLGIIDESVRAGEMEDLFADAGVTLDSPTTAMFSWMEVLEDFTKRRGKEAQDLYRAGDTFWKIAAFQIEKQRYADAKPEWTESRVEEKAATRVRNTYPTYSLVPRFIKKFRRNPVSAPFVSFFSEVFRTQYHTLRIIKEDWADPATRGIALKRALGAIASQMMFAGVTYGTMMLTGLDGEDDEALRRFLPSWSKFSNLAFLPADEGEASYVDLGYLNPYQYMHQPVVDFLAGDATDSVWEAIKAVARPLRPFTNSEILTRRAYEAWYNQSTETGQPVVNPELPADERAWGKAMHVVEAFEPGLTQQAWDVGTAFGEEGLGTDRNPASELTAIVLGQRVKTIDMANSLKWETIGYERRYRNASRIWTDALTQRGTVSEQELREAYRQSLRAKQEIVEHVHKDIRAAQAFGLAPKEAYSVMRSVGVGAKRASQAMANRFVPEVEPNMLKGRIESALASGRKSDARVLRRRRKMALRIMEEERQRFLKQQPNAEDAVQAAREGVAVEQRDEVP